MANDTHADFVLESREHLQTFESSMLALENATSEQETCDFIDESFRAVHSLKGNAGFLGFKTVQQLAHSAENILGNYRNQSVAPPPVVVETILLANDRLSAMIEDLDHSESHDISDILQKLQSLDTSISDGTSESGHSEIDNVFGNRMFSNGELHVSLQMPSPPASVLPLLESLESLEALDFLQIGDVDLHESASDWPHSDLVLECRLPSDRSVVEVHRLLSDVGVSLNWSKFGAIDLSGHKSEQIFEQLVSAAGKLVYEPENLERGLPHKPIVWLPGKPHVAVIPAKVNQLTNEEVPVVAAKPIEREPVRRVESTVVEAPPVKTPAPNQLIESSPQVESQKTVKVKESGHPAGEAVSDRPTSLRIQVDLLDRLMNLVSELTLVRNQSLIAFGNVDGTPRAVIQRLNSVTSELQDTVLKTRMQPVGNLFSRFPRMVRDLARQLGKQVELVMIGQEVELDKTVLEQLSDPLTHLIRNSVDHGLETPDVRTKLGKQPVGQVTLSAAAADGQVIIEIRDDGRGIDPNAVRNKVVALGLKTEAELQKVSMKELYSYILLPGFSTAKQVSDISGRGVGMDVVKTNVERLEGSLTIDSTRGLGTSMLLRVPLTLAIIPCLIVTVGNQRFAVPQRGLEEIVCLHPGGRGAIEHSYDAELYRLRDLLLPIVRFKDVLASHSPFSAKTKAAIMAANSPLHRDAKLIEYILVLRTGGRKFGLLIDDICGTEEVVVKPMHPSLKKIGIFAGATLMGDGRVTLIANIDGIAEHARCYGIEPPDKAAATLRDPAEVHRILLFEYGPKELFAVPLVQVRRIESISMDKVEYIGDQAFITIDGIATRIVRLNQHLNVSASENEPTMHLLLPKYVSEPMGILVSRIVDTESLSIDLQEASIADPGILGTAIVRGRLCLFLDTQYLREKLFGSRAIQVPEIQTHSSNKDLSKSALSVKEAPHILLVDDTPFFREVVRRYFEREGLVVTTAIDGNDGMRKLSSQTFDLVVSDIEMPNMDGWGFCKAARKAGYKTPFLALTSLNKEENASKAIEYGFDRFEEKIDHDRLIGSVRDMLGMPPKEVINGR